MHLAVVCPSYHVHTRVSLSLSLSLSSLFLFPCFFSVHLVSRVFHFSFTTVKDTTVDQIQGGKESLSVIIVDKFFDYESTCEIDLNRILMALLKNVS